MIWPPARRPDRPYAAAFAIKTIGDVAAQVDCYSYWTFSDIFEESPFPSEPFHGGFGMLTLHDVPKSVYRAFQLLKRAGTVRFAVAPQGTIDVLATRKLGRISVLLTNHHVPLAKIQTEPVEIRIANGRVTGPALIERIDETHANPRAKWMAMGSPVYPTTGQIKAMVKASEMKTEKMTLKKTGKEWSLRLSIPPHGTAGITVPVG